MNVFSETDRSLLSELRQITEVSESDGLTTGLQEINCNYIGLHNETPILYNNFMGKLNCETNSDHCH